MTLRDFSTLEEMELHRLWTEDSEAGKRIAKLEQEEQTSLDDKLQSVEEDQNRLFAKRVVFCILSRDCPVV